MPAIDRAVGAHDTALRTLGSAASLQRGVEQRNKDISRQKQGQRIGAATGAATTFMALGGPANPMAWAAGGLTLLGGLF